MSCGGHPAPAPTGHRALRRRHLAEPGYKWVSTGGPCLFAMDGLREGGDPYRDSEVRVTGGVGGWGLRRVTLSRAFLTYRVSRDGPAASTWRPSPSKPTPTGPAAEVGTRDKDSSCPGCAPHRSREQPGVLTMGPRHRTRLTLTHGNLAIRLHSSAEKPLSGQPTRWPPRARGLRPGAEPGGSR